MMKVALIALFLILNPTWNVNAVFGTYRASDSGAYLDGNWKLDQLDLKVLEREVINEGAGKRGSWTVQVSALSMEREALQLAKKLKDKGYNAYVAPIDIKGVTLYRVRVGLMATHHEAQKLQEALKNKEKYGQAFVTAEFPEERTVKDRPKLKATVRGQKTTDGGNPRRNDFPGAAPVSLISAERTSVNDAPSNGNGYESTTDQEQTPVLPAQRVRQQEVAQAERQVDETRSITIGPAVAERGGVLLRRGQFEIAPETRYALQSTNRIIISGLAVLPALVIGNIEAAKVQRNVVESSVSFRYGILDDLQFEARIPWRYSNDRITTLGTGATPAREIRTNDIAFGDLEGSINYEVLREGGLWPAVVAGLGLRTTTGKDPFEVGQNELPSGTGFWGLRGALSAVKARDPVVLFGRLGYTTNFTRTVSLNPPAAAPAGRTRINPGDTIEWGMGFGYALSPEFSLNSQFVHRVTLRSKIEKVRVPVLAKGKVPGTFLNIPEVRFGGVWAYTRDRFADISVSVGLSEDAPDATFQLSFPFRFESPRGLLRMLW